MDATGSHLSPYAELGLAALRGRQAEAAALIDATIREANLRGEGIGIAARRVGERRAEQRPR